MPRSLSDSPQSQLAHNQEVTGQASPVHLKTAVTPLCARLTCPNTALNRPTTNSLLEFQTKVRNGRRRRRHIYIV